MGFIVYPTAELNMNEKMISFYKKELQASHIIHTAKKMKFYNTKRYRKNVSYNFPGAKRYQRVSAIVGSHYKKTKKKVAVSSWLGGF